MIKTKIGREKMEISKIGLGTVQFGLDYGFTKKKSQDEVDEILFSASNLGITFLDTARAYGDSENKIGRFLEHNKNKFTIATKLSKISQEEAQRKDKLKYVIYKSIEESLKALKIDRIHLLQLHQPDMFIYKNENFWKLMQDAKDEGMISAFGVSIYDENEINTIIGRQDGIVEVVQLPYNVFDRRFERYESELKGKDIGVVSRSAFLKGIITCDIEVIPDELNDIIPKRKLLEEYSGKKSRSVSSLALAYVYSKGFLSSTIIGINSSKELGNNIEAIDRPLTRDDIEFLDSLKLEDSNLLDPRKWKSL